MTGTVLFRVDAGPDVGLGHLQRCLSLAVALRRLGAHCLFLTNEDLAVKNRVKGFGFELKTLKGIQAWSGKGLNATLEMVAEWMCDAVVTDSYHVDADYLGRLQATGLFVVAIDDLARHPFPCQLVVNGGVHAESLPYRSSSSETVFRLGSRYALLGQEFWKVPPRTVRETVTKVLVALGGADPFHLMPRVLGALEVLPGEFTVTAVIGPFFKKSRRELERVAKSAQQRVWLVNAPRSLRELMVEADLAVSASGQMLYELAAVGTPTIAIETAPNQHGQLQGFVERGIVRAVGKAEDSDMLTALCNTACKLLEDQETRAVMSAGGQRLVNGRGAIRIAQTMVETLTRSASQ